MSDEGERILTAVGVAIAALIVVGLAVAALAVANGPSADAEDVPEAAWRVERVNDTHVRLVHGGGDPVEADRLVVMVDGYERSTAWPDRVAEGDAGVLEARRDSLVRLYWSAGRDDRALLGDWRV